MEVNASDERSASVLTDRVTRAMESTTLSFQQQNGIYDPMNGRPNCIILDEVDGADAKSSIAALLKIIQAEKPIKGTKSYGKKTYLRRPIIFICNHKYAPTLRPLLPYARQFDVSPPSTDRMVSRLRSILAEENMTVVSGAGLLRQLISAAGGDIRSCLHTLQFASARAREIHFLTKKKRNDIDLDLHNSVVDISPVLNVALNGDGPRGMKDTRSDIIGTLKSVFRKIKLKRAAGDNSTSSSSKLKRDVERVLQIVDTFGDVSKTLDGIFLNLLNVSYIDPTLDRCWTAHEWLSSIDVYRSHKTSAASNNHAEHRLIQNCHIPAAAAAIHILCRVETSPDLTFSMRPLLDSIYQLEANNALIHKFLEGLSPKAKSGLTSYGFASEVLPYCSWLLSAGEGNGALSRDVSSIEILTKEEKSSFDAHVEMLQTLGLTYKRVDESDVQQGHMNMRKDNSFGVEMRLEPEIDKVLHFQGIPKSILRRNDVPPVMKELLAHATSVATLRQQELLEPKGKNKRKKENNSQPSPAAATLSTMIVAEESKLKSKPESEIDFKIDEKMRVKATKNFLGIGASRARAARSARKAAQVGFDRSKNKKKFSNTGSGVPLDEVIKFRFQKGFTQAVRLPCSKDDFTLF